MTVAASRVAAAAAVSVVVMAIDSARRRALSPPSWPLTAALGVTGLAVLTLVTRLPYFFVDVINWDESTFILMGHAFANGHLPYTLLWDNKPPLLFAIFGVLARFAGDPVFIARTFGALCVLVNALLVARIASSLVEDRAAGAIAALLYVFGMAVSPSGEAAMSELVSAVPLLAAVWLLADVRRRTAGSYAAVGALVAAATLIRLNLGFVAVAFGLWIIASQRRAGARRLLVALGAYVGAGLMVLVVCALPYAVTGSLGLFWYSVFRAPFRYATTQDGVLEHLVQNVRNVLDLHVAEAGKFAFSWMGWVASLIGFALVVRDSRALPPARNGTVWVVVLAGFGTGLSVLLTGAALEHYLLALVPFVAIFAGAAYAALARLSRSLVLAILAIVAAFVAYQIVPAYVTVGRRLVDGEPLMHGEAYAVADYLRPRCMQHCTAYLMVDHLAYVLLGLDPPRKSVTHPSNVARRSLLDPQIGTESSPERELGAILALKPDYIVKPDRVPYLEPQQQALLDATLAADYEVAAVIGDSLVYHARKP